MLIALLGIVISVVNVGLTCCICGHLDIISLPGSLIGLIAAWYAMFRAKDIKVFRRVVIGIACIVTTLTLFKNVCDILWLGHNPLLP